MSVHGEPLRAVVADDSLITREGVAHLLELAGVQVVAQVDGPVALLESVRRERPDVAVIDIRMPPTHTDEGLVAALQIRAEDDTIAVLVLSQYIEPSYAMRLLQEHPEGMGYLLKDRILDGAVLVDALRRLREGESVVDPTIVAKLFGRRRDPDPVAALSAREREVLALLAEGLSNRGIADRLTVTERTVEAHITHAFEKLALSADAGTHRRVLAVLAYLRSPSAS